MIFLCFFITKEWCIFSCRRVLNLNVRVHSGEFLDEGDHIKAREFEQEAKAGQSGKAGKLVKAGQSAQAGKSGKAGQSMDNH